MAVEAPRIEEAFPAFLKFLGDRGWWPQRPLRPLVPAPSCGLGGKLRPR